MGTAWRVSASRLMPPLVLACGGLVLLAACIIEGCTVDHTRRGETAVRFALDAERPIMVSRATISISAESFPEVLPGDLRVTSGFDGAAGLLLTLVRTSTGEVLTTIGPTTGARLGVHWCAPGKACEIDVTAIVEWLEPEPGTLRATWTFGAAINYPHSEERCGPPAGAGVTATASEPEAATSVAAASLADERAVTEMSTHVSFELSAAEPGTGGVDDLEGLVASAEVRIEAAPVPGDAGRQYVPGAWLRITPDDGRGPIVDGPLAEGFMSADPGLATFAILEGCDRLPCRRGYWVQLLVFDPAGRATERTMAPVRWSVRGAVADLAADSEITGRLAISSNGPPPGDRPPPLVTEGSGEPFAIEPGGDAWTLRIAAAMDGRALPPGVDDPARHTGIFVALQPIRDPADEGEIWLADGHWIGDGYPSPTVPTSAWGGQSGAEHPEAPGRPLRACAGSVDPCSATTGLVIRHHRSPFAENNAERFAVAYRWEIVGAPVGATWDIRAVPGETLEGDGRPPPDLLRLASLTAIGLAGLLTVRVLLRRRAQRRK